MKKRENILEQIKNFKPVSNITPDSDFPLFLQDRSDESLICIISSTEYFCLTTGIHHTQIFESTNPDNVCSPLTKFRSAGQRRYTQMSKEMFVKIFSIQLNLFTKSILSKIPND